MPPSKDELCAAVRNRELEKKWRIGPLSHGPPRPCAWDHLLTRLWRSRAVDTDNQFTPKDDIGNIIDDHVYERESCVRFNDPNIHPRLRANEKFNKIIDAIWKLAADWYAPNVDDVHCDTDRAMTDLAFYKIKPGRTDVRMPFHLHLQHAGPRSPQWMSHEESSSHEAVDNDAGSSADFDHTDVDPDAGPSSCCADSVGGGRAE
eukprot:530446-Pleurochrysis_carterae.AAC.1